MKPGPASVDTFQKAQMRHRPTTASPRCSWPSNSRHDHLPDAKFWPHEPPLDLRSDLEGRCSAPRGRPPAAHVDGTQPRDAHHGATVAVAVAAAAAAAPTWAATEVEQRLGAAQLAQDGAALLAHEEGGGVGGGVAAAAVGAVAVAAAAAAAQERQRVQHRRRVRTAARPERAPVGAALRVQLQRRILAQARTAAATAAILPAYFAPLLRLIFK